MNGYYQFKEAMLRRAMELWGIQDRNTIDPIIDLLLEVFAYEISKIHHDIKDSDQHLLGRLSRILVSSKLSLPSPAHALVVMETESDDELEVNDAFRFYTSRIEKGGEAYEINFSPLYSERIIKGHVEYLLVNNQVSAKDDLGFRNVIGSVSDDHRTPNHEIFVGIDISQETLDNITQLPLCVMSTNKELSSYISLIEVMEMSGNVLTKESVFEKKNNSNSIELNQLDVCDYYSNYLYYIQLDGASRGKRTLSDIGFYDEEEGQDQSYYWIRLKFPENFNQSALEEISVTLNTLPLINKTMVKLEHNVRNKGRIIPLKYGANSKFLGVRNLEDNGGNRYVSLEESTENIKKGTYSLYFGELEKFDNRSAKDIVTKALQSIQEEASSFYSLDAENIERELSDISKILSRLDVKYSDRASSFDDRTYLITNPFDGVYNYGLEYWVTQAEKANGLAANTILQPYRSDAFKESSIVLLTETVGGRKINSEQERINSLRYGLLTKDRLVTKEDIKSYVKHALGDRCKHVEVKKGVAISSLPSRGLLRTIDVDLVIDENLSSENRRQLEYFLVNAIKKRSMHTTNYRVRIINKKEDE